MLQTRTRRERNQRRKTNYERRIVLATADLELSLMKNENPVKSKSFELALSVIKVYKHLKKQNEFVLAKQILKSGTSVGANVEEAIGGQSKKDFLMKITIAYKEARETAYWLELLEASNYIPSEMMKKVYSINTEVLRLLGTIQKSTKRNLDL